MARKAADDGSNRSSFLRDQLKANPKLKVKEVNAAWKAASGSGEISNSLFYQIKNKLGIRSGKGGKRGPRPKGAPDSAVAPVANDREAALLKMETDLDKLVGVAESLGDRHLTDALRGARRRVSAKLV